MQMPILLYKNFRRFTDRAGGRRTRLHARAVGGSVVVAARPPEAQPTRQAEREGGSRVV